MIDSCLCLLAGAWLLFQMTTSCWSPGYWLRPWLLHLQALLHALIYLLKRQLQKTGLLLEVGSDQHCTVWIVKNMSWKEVIIQCHGIERCGGNWYILHHSSELYLIHTYDCSCMHLVPVFFCWKNTTCGRWWSKPRSKFDREGATFTASFTYNATQHDRCICKECPASPCFYWPGRIG